MSKPVFHSCWACVGATVGSIGGIDYNAAMNFYGARIFCSLIGLLFGGFSGMLIGFCIGWFLDNAAMRSIGERFGFGVGGTHHTQQVFFRTSFQILGYLAKADGRVSEKEIKAAEHIMQKLSLNAAQKQEARQAFNEGKQPGFDWLSAINALKRSCWMRPILLKTFLEIQLYMSQADGLNSSATQQALENIYRALGIHGFTYSQFEQAYRAQQNYGGHAGGQSGFGGRASVSTLSQAYTLLGVSQSATKDDVKKAYRKLMSENHPDKLIAQGLPEEMIKLATEKTQKIQRAYDDICKAKGW